MHAPKQETFNLAARTNTDPKGIVRDVDVFTVHPWGLYMARPTPGREQFHYLESWLLPDLGLRISIFHFNAGYERDQDFYLDVGRFSHDDQVWSAEDHYLDLVLRNGIDVELTDVDELLEAVVDGLISTVTATAAVRIATTTIDGLARHGYDLADWLNDHGMALTWRTA